MKQHSIDDVSPEGAHLPDAMLQPPSTAVVAADEDARMQMLSQIADAEAREIFSNDTIDIHALYSEIATQKSEAASRAMAKAHNHCILENWTKGKYTYEIVREGNEPKDLGNVIHTVYEGMPADVFTGNFPKPVEGGVVRLRLLFRLGWEEDEHRHQHIGGREVTMKKGTGKFEAVDDEGKKIVEDMTRSKLVCMPTYTTHNFRALTKREAAEYFSEKAHSPEWGLEGSDADNIARTAATLIEKIKWDNSCTDQQQIDREIAEAKEMMEQGMATDPVMRRIAGSNGSLAAEITSELTALLTLELDSVHVGYVDVNDPVYSLFHELNEDGSENKIWRKDGISRTEHDKNVESLRTKKA